MSRDWIRPALLAAAALAALAWLRGGVNATRVFDASPPWWLPFSLGAAAGTAIFLVIYLASYRERPRVCRLAVDGFADPAQLERPAPGPAILRRFRDAAHVRGRVRPRSPGACAGARRGLARPVGYCAWALLVSAAVIVAPLTIGGFSIWMTVFARLPS